MFIIYHASRVFGLLFGIAIGGAIVFFASGWGGGVIGLTLGITVGWLSALLPSEIVRHSILLSLRWSDSKQLKDRLAREHGLAPMIIEVLVSRGEPIEDFREHIQVLLQSTSRHRRSIGRKLGQKWFPDLLKQPIS